MMSQIWCVNILCCVTEKRVYDLYCDIKQRRAVSLLPLTHQQAVISGNMIDCIIIYDLRQQSAQFSPLSALFLLYSQFTEIR